MQFKILIQGIGREDDPEAVSLKSRLTGPWNEGIRDTVTIGGSDVFGISDDVEIERRMVAGGIVDPVSHRVGPTRPYRQPSAVGGLIQREAVARQEETALYPPVIAEPLRIIDVGVYETGLREIESAHLRPVQRVRIRQKRDPIGTEAAFRPVVEIAGLYPEANLS